MEQENKVQSGEKDKQDAEINALSNNKKTITYEYIETLLDKSYFGVLNWLLTQEQTRNKTLDLLDWTKYMMKNPTRIDVFLWGLYSHKRCMTIDHPNELRDPEGRQPLENPGYLPTLLATIGNVDLVKIYEVEIGINDEEMLLIDDNGDFYSILMEAVEHGRIEYVSWFIDRYKLTKQDILADDGAYFLGAADNNHYGMVKWLCEKFEVTKSDIRRSISDLISIVKEECKDKEFKGWFKQLMK